MKKEHLTPSVIEFAAFTLKPGIIEERLLECSQELQTEFLSRQPGFIKRELVRKSETEFVDIVYWENIENAERAVENAMESPACFAYFQLMEEADHNDPSHGVHHYRVLSTYSKELAE